MKIAGLLLAAGASQRLGRAKQLLQIDGEPLIRRAARALLEGGCAPLYVVLGAEFEACQSALGELPLQILFNRHYRDGMGTSVAAGIIALRETTLPDAVVLALCDQPFLDRELVSALIQHHHNSPTSIVACDYGATQSGPFGPPALFTAQHFDELAQLDGDQGARGLFKAHADEMASVSFAQGRIDIDTAADWRQFE